jgi:hypothetical protein
MDGKKNNDKSHGSRNQTTKGIGERGTSTDQPADRSHDGNL